MAEMPGKEDPFRGQLIDIWCPDLIHPVATQLGAQVIYGNEQDIGATGHACITTGTLEKSKDCKCQQGD